VSTPLEARRQLDRLENRIGRMVAQTSDPDAHRVSDALRYTLSFARLSTVNARDGREVALGPRLADHAAQVRSMLSSRVDTARNIWDLARSVPTLSAWTRHARQSLLDDGLIDRDSLEEEVCSRKLVVASGGGGGAGYVYPGVYEVLERTGLVPDLMVGTSIGSLMSMFRARRRRYDPAPMVAAARSLAWSNVFRVLETENRYGLPASLRLYLRAALGYLFKRPDSTPLWLSDLEIPLYVVATGITVDALKHDLGYYEHLLDDELGQSWRSKVSGVVKVMTIFREFMQRPDALAEVVLGRDPGTEDFDVLDAAGFSAAIPGVIHYDVLRDDQRMKRILDALYQNRGITRLGEGGMISNVPARIGWEAVATGRLGRRNSFVLALDCLAPNPRQPAWLPLALAVRAANVDADRYYADSYITFPQSLSPMNLVPPIRDFLLAMQWGREAVAAEVPFIREMMRPIPVLGVGHG
jgi:predicted acylesterase/phospholipase RssA